MGIFIDKVDVYCDGNRCDSKVELQLDDGDVSRKANWFEEIANHLPSWDLGLRKTYCPNCLDRQEELQRRKEELEEVIQKLERED